MSRQSWPRSSTRSRKTKTGHLQENVYCGSSTCWTMLHKKMKTARNKREKKQPTLKADKQTKQIKQVQTNGSNKTFYYGLIMLILCFKFKVHFIESLGKKSIKIRVRFHSSDSTVLEELLLIRTPPPHLPVVSNDWNHRASWLLRERLFDVSILGTLRITLCLISVDFLL